MRTLILPGLGLFLYKILGIHSFSSFSPLGIWWDKFSDSLGLSFWDGLLLSFKLFQNIFLVSCNIICPEHPLSSNCLLSLTFSQYLCFLDYEMIPLWLRWFQLGIFHLHAQFILFLLDSNFIRLPFITTFNIQGVHYFYYHSTYFFSVLTFTTNDNFVTICLIFSLVTAFCKLCIFWSLDWTTG